MPPVRTNLACTLVLLGALLLGASCARVSPEETNSTARQDSEPLYAAPAEGSPHGNSASHHSHEGVRAPQPSSARSDEEHAVTKYLPHRDPDRIPLVARSAGKRAAVSRSSTSSDAAAGQNPDRPQTAPDSDQNHAAPGIREFQRSHRAAGPAPPYPAAHTPHQHAHRPAHAAEGNFPGGRQQYPGRPVVSPVDDSAGVLAGTGSPGGTRSQDLWRLEVEAGDPGELFSRRILPILKSGNSSCSECHFAGVDLKDYIRDDQSATFAALRERGLIDVKQPDASQILKFIARTPARSGELEAAVRRREFLAFRAWIHAAVRDPELLKTPLKSPPAGTQLPVEVIRHARKDRVLNSFVEQIWSEIARCSGCHSPERNQKQVGEFGQRVSWITPGDPQATLNHLVKASLIDVDFPEDSLLLAKPTLQVEHGGGKKMEVGDRSYKQFRSFIEDYAAVVKGRYKSPDELPPPAEEVSAATSMEDGIWLKLTDVPARFDKMLLRVDLYPREGNGWSKSRAATADRAVAGDKNLWQQTLTLTAPRDSARAADVRRLRLPPGEYLVKVYVDQAGRLQKDYQARLGSDDFVGEVIVNSAWPTGYGRMTVARFPQQACEQGQGSGRPTRVASVGPAKVGESRSEVFRTMLDRSWQVGAALRRVTLAAQCRTTRRRISIAATITARLPTHMDHTGLTVPDLERFCINSTTG